MKFISSAIFLLLFVFLLSSCRRDFARFQRTPYVSHRQPSPTVTTKTSEVADNQPVVENPGLPEDRPINQPLAEASATTNRVPVTSTDQRTRQHMQRINRILSAEPARTSDLPQPRPRPKAKQQEKKTIREILGLKPRPKLNWWQSIPWQVKASVVVIAVALAFALLKVTLMAVIFGLIGAYLLVRGLKKSFKVRRPWF